MHIALVSEVFLPKLDGVVRKVQHLLEHFDLRGHESILFVPYNKHMPAQYCNTPITMYPSAPVPFYPEIKAASPFTRLEEELTVFKPDLVHLINPTSLGVAGLRAALNLGLPVVASYHTDMSGFAAEWNLAFLGKPIHNYYRWIHNQCDLNLAPSEWTKNELLDLGYKRMGVWRGGVDIDRFTPAKRTTAWRVRLTQGNTKKPLIISVSRLSREKRMDMLLPLVKDIDGIRLAIIGDGPYRDELVKMFEGTPTVFTGYLNGEDLAHAYAAGDIFVFNGKHETFGNVVLEAMASGLPVVVPNAGGVTDIVNHGISGLLYEPNDYQGLINSTRFLMTNRMEALRMGETGRQTAEQRTWEITLDEVVAQYEQLLETKEPGMEESTLSQIPRAWQQIIQDFQSRVPPQ